MVEALPRLAPLEDEEVSKEIARAFRKRGIASYAGAKVQEVKEAGDRVEVTYEANGGGIRWPPTCAWSRSAAGP